MRSTLTIILALLAFTAFAQTSNDGIRAAVLDYIEGFYEGDTVKLKRSVASNLYKYGYWRDNKTNAYAGEPMSFREAVDYCKNVQKKKNFAKADAPKTVVVLDAEEQVASAKCTAWWGIDYLLLAKKDGKWMIEQVLWQGPIESVKKL